MLRRFLALAPQERRTVIGIGLALVAVRFRRRLLSGAATAPVAHLSTAEAAVAPLRARRLARLVQRTADALPFRTTCLMRAVVAHELLASRGFASEVRLAVKREGDALDAHAWLEHDGQILLEPPADGYVPL